MCSSSSAVDKLIKDENSRAYLVLSLLLLFSLVFLYFLQWILSCGCSICLYWPEYVSISPDLEKWSRCFVKTIKKDSGVWLKKKKTFIREVWNKMRNQLNKLWRLRHWNKVTCVLCDTVKAKVLCCVGGPSSLGPLAVHMETSFVCCGDADPEDHMCPFESCVLTVSIWPSVASGGLGTRQVSAGTIRGPSWIGPLL